MILQLFLFLELRYYLFALSGLSGGGSDQREKIMAFYAFYAVAIVILILHFTGWLKRHNLEWLILALAVGTFPAVIFLK